MVIVLSVVFLKTIKKGKEFLSAIKKTFKYKYGKTLKTSDIPKDVWTHATKSKEALKTWDKGKKIVGRGEDLSKFTRQIDQGTHGRVLPAVVNALQKLSLCFSQ